VWQVLLIISTGDCLLNTSLYHCHLPCHPLQTANGSLPRPGNVSDGDKLLELVRALNEAKGEDKVELDEGVLRKFASGVCVGGVHMLPQVQRVPLHMLQHLLP
jgi:hypothetical protein